MDSLNYNKNNILTKGFKEHQKGMNNYGNCKYSGIYRIVC